MNRQGWPENLPSRVLSRIPPLYFDMRQSFLALVLNLGIVGISAFVLISIQKPAPHLLDILLFLPLLSFIAWSTADLPEGIPLMRYGTAVALAALIFDSWWAILLAVAASGIGFLISLSFRYRREPRPEPRQIITRSLWVNAGVSAAMTVASTVFPGAIPTSDAVLTNLVEYGRSAAMLIVYYVLLLGMFFAWLRYRQMQLRAFIRANWGALAVNGLIPGLFIPLVALAYVTWPGLRIPVIVSYVATDAISNWFNRAYKSLTGRLGDLRAVGRIGQAINAQLDLETVMDQVALAATSATGAEFCEVALYDEAADSLRVVARRNESPDAVEINEWPASRGLTGRAIRTKQTILVNEVLSDPDYHNARASVQSELVVPILLEGQRLGIINLESSQAGWFSQDHARFVTSLAEHSAIAIQNARLFEAVKKRAEEFNTLREIALELLSSSDVRDTLRVIARGALERTQATSIHIYLYDQDDEDLTFGTSLWSNGLMDHEFTTPRPNGLPATVARTGERTVIAQASEHPLYANPQNFPGWDQEVIERLQAIIGFPLKRGREVVGVMNIAFEDKRILEDDMLRYLDFLAAQAAVAIANAQLQEETRTGRDLLKAILDSSHDGILMFNAENHLMMANSRSERLLGISLQEEIGRTFSSFIRRTRRSCRSHDAIAGAQAHKLAREIKENPSAMTRRRYGMEDPVRRTIEEISVPVIGHTEENLGRMFILRDITHELELEEFRQEMSHMLVHDLRSPLAGVISGIHSALEEVVPEMRTEPKSEMDVELVEQLLSVSLTSANSLLTLVESILDVNRLEMGEIPLALDSLDLRRVAQSAMQTLSQTAMEAGITITLDAPPEIPRLRADQEKIERVLINLLDNSLRFTPQGGAIRLGVTVRPQFVQVTIADSGPGIPPDHRERIFERFVQVNASNRIRGSKGSGMGLTFCKLAVEAHGGQIWVDQAPEGGAAFHFTLPTEMNPIPESDTAR